MTTIDPTKMDAAKEWADIVRDGLPVGQNSNCVRAAAEVIDALPDTIVDGDKLREVMEWFDRQPMGDDYEAEFVQQLNALLPDPPLPTLADMTEEERQACRWMQANFNDGTAERPVRVVITKAGKTTADIILPGGAAHWVHVGKLTPLPDLPRMVWPDEHHPATEETPAQPSPEDVKPGVPWIVEHVGHEWVGQRAWGDVKVPWIVTRVVPGDDTDFEYCRDDEVTLVSRLVPEVKA